MNVAVVIDEAGRNISPDVGETGPASKRIVVAYGFWIFLLSDVVMFSALFASYAVSCAQRRVGRPATSCSVRLASRSRPLACWLPATPVG